MAAVALRGLYAITPDMADTEQLLKLVGKALEGGVKLFQYRNKTADAALRKYQARMLVVACRYRGACLIVNDDIDLARTVGAAGVHLGKDDGDISIARQRLGRDAIIGVSCYADWHRAQQAQRLGASYIAFGAFFPSPTKPNAARAQTALLTRARKELGLPVAAIGGITADNGGTLVKAGADMLAVVTDLFKSRDVKRRAMQYQALFVDHETGLASQDQPS